MRFLVTNDDGIWAPGLKALAAALVELGEVWVLAPDRERSATGHAITVHKPLRPEQVELGVGEKGAWHLNGTPADCVKLALEVMLPTKPTFVCSGINRGANLGTDVLYSGTVSAAVEGTIYGIPSLAVSNVSTEGDYQAAAAFIKRFLGEMGQVDAPALYNINIPPGEPQETRVTTLGVRRYCNVFQKRQDPRGKAYYWLAGEQEDCKNDPASDLNAIEEGLISITPLSFKLTDEEERQQLAKFGW